MHQLLQHWFAEPQRATVHPVACPGFSGARLWQVEHGDQRFALRRWPAPAGPPSRLYEIHGLQRHLACRGLPVPAPTPSIAGGVIVEIDGAWWELAPWMPGAADYWHDPRPAKLIAAMQTLAQLHLGAADYVSPAGRGGLQNAASPAITRRDQRARALLGGELEILRTAVRRAAASADGPLAAEALDLLQRALPSLAARLATWPVVELPTQWRLGDVWHDHVLFTGDRVTGVIDFGAAAVDWPAGDVARLLGSLVADDPARWSQGLAAYEAIRPLADNERRAVRLLDASGTVLSTANWLQWLFVEAAPEPPAWDRGAALARLRRLAARLRVHVEKRG